MSDTQKPIRTFNVRDEDNKVYEVKVFKIPMGANLDNTIQKDFEGEIMYTQENIIVQENSPKTFLVEIDGITKELFLC